MVIILFSGSPAFPAADYTLAVDEPTPNFPVPFLVYGREKR
jgi:hypothetical protein